MNNPKVFSRPMAGAPNHELARPNLCFGPHQLAGRLAQQLLGVRSENGKYRTLSYKSVLITSRLGKSKTAVRLDNLSRLLPLTGNRSKGPKTVQKTCSPIKVQENRPTRWKNCIALVAYRSRNLGRNSPSVEPFSLTCSVFRFLRGPLHAVKRFGLRRPVQHELS